MKTRFCFFFLLLIPFSVQGNDHLSALMPMPNRIIEKDKGTFFTVCEQTVLTISTPDLHNDAIYLAEIFSSYMGISLEAGSTNVPGKKRIDLMVNDRFSHSQEYILDVSEEGIRIEGGSCTGVFYGIITLEQILLGDPIRTLHQQIAGIRIEDIPRMEKRVLMLDPARHFLPVEDVKSYIDIMAKYKYNVLQLHLTDDHGWRIEIKKHPALTEVGAIRNPAQGMNGPDNGYYTQDQLRDIVAYAGERHIEIIPEIDIPGHTVSVLAVYPELGCSHTQTIEKNMGETVDLMVCAGNEKVYDVLQDILSEVTAIFPSPLVHLGGDEAAIHKNWSECRHCQELKKKHGYTKDAELMNYFFSKLVPVVRELGKTPVMWCELDNIRMPANEYLFPYPQDVVLVAWRGGLTEKVIELSEKSGNPLLLAPGEYAYLDYPQYKGDLPEFKNWGMPVTTLRKTYEFDPYYEEDLVKPHIMGICGTLWGEAIEDMNRVFYMTYPRAWALAEAGWTNRENRDWDSFKERLSPHILYLFRKGIPVRVPFEIYPRE